MWNRPFLAVAIVVFAPLALFLPACGGGGGGGDDAMVDAGGNPLEQPPVGNPLEAPAIELTVPEHAALQVPRNTPIQIEFLVPIDASSVQLDSIGLEGSKGPVPGTTQLITETILSFLPDEFLPYGDTYVVTLRPGIRAQSGEERTTAYAYAFRAYESEFNTDTLHESLSTDCRLRGLEINAAGDGLSMFSDNGTGSGNLRFRRIRGGVPVGAVGIVGPGFAVWALDIAENGNGQAAWITGNNDPATAEAFVSQFNRSSESWGEVFPLTPDAGVAAVDVEAEMTNNGGLVAWIERDFDDGDNHRLLAAQYTNGSGLSNVSQLGSSTGTKGWLMLSRRGLHGVLAFTGSDPDPRVQASRFLGALGFQAVEFLDPGNNGTVKAVTSSASGHLFVLFTRKDPVTNDSTWMLSVANPGQPFGAPMPLHANPSSGSRGRLAAGDNGIVTALYGLGGSNSGTWVRRYTPGSGLSAASEMTGVSRSSSDFDSQGLEADAAGNAVAVAVVSSGSGQTVRAAVLPVDGPQTLGLVLSDEPDGAPTSPEVRLALEPSGGAMIQWLSRLTRLPSHYALRTQRIRSDGTYGYSFIYNGTSNGTDTSVISNTHLAMTADGNGLILYDKLGANSGGIGPDDIHQALID